MLKSIILIILVLSFTYIGVRALEHEDAPLATSCIVADVIFGCWLFIHAISV